ncbi:MAG: hypothetical protein ABEJ57_05940 [Halobacteriaceae archaeon]
MVERTVEDGRRIAALLASELSGRSDGALARVTVADADRSVTGSAAGERAYDVALDGAVIGAVYVHEHRGRLTLETGVDTARETAASKELRVRAVPGPSPRVHVFVPDGGAVKRVVGAVTAVADAR